MQAFSAQVAVFCVDVNSPINFESSGEDVNGDLKQMEWLVNGKSVNYSSGKVEVPFRADVMDTILFRQHLQAKWDTILCNIKHPRVYQFQYNHCCNAFDIADSNGRIVDTRITFEVIGNQSNRQYLGTFGDGAVLCEPNKINTLELLCWSPMTPNIHWVSFKEIEPCTEQDCEQNACLFTYSATEPDFGFGYFNKRQWTEFLFMPLDQEALHVIFDESLGEIRLK